MADTQDVFDFGYRLKGLRDSRGWTQTELAERIDTTKESIYRYENNLQTPPFEKMKLLAQTFRTSVDYLVGWENDPIIKLHGLSEKQRKALLLFCDAFLDTSNSE